MSGYNDPDHEGNSPRYHTGKPCIVDGCEEPAGTAWGPHWCFKHNVERIDRCNKGFTAVLAEFESEKKT